LAIAAEGGDSLEIAVGLGQGHYGAVAVKRRGRWRRSTSVRLWSVGHVADGAAQWLGGIYNRHAKVVVDIVLNNKARVRAFIAVNLLPPWRARSSLKPAP